MSDLAAGYAALDTARDHVRDAAEMLNAERRRLDEDLRGFLDGEWTGAAAEQFCAAFGEWSQGAETVLAGLDSTAQLVEQAKGFLVAGDGDATGSMGRLHGRLSGL